MKDRLAARSPFLAHLFRTLDHYKEQRGNLAAGGATYFAFLSFFPLLAVSFAIVGQLSQVYPNAQEDFVEALSGVLPGIVSVDPQPGTIALSEIAANAPAIYTVGLLTALYSGLKWVSGLRDGLNQMIGLPVTEARNLVLGKATDLMTLVVLGLVLIASVSVGSIPVALGSTILDALGLTSWFGSAVLFALSFAVGVGVSTVLFWSIYRLLPKPDLPARSLWKGALFAAIGFEIVKQFASLVLRGASSVPVASLAIALTLVVWIYFFSRLTMYGLSWATTDREALEAAELAEQQQPRHAVADSGQGAEDRDEDEPAYEPLPAGYGRAFVAGLGVGGIIGAAVSRRVDD